MSPVVGQKIRLISAAFHNYGGRSIVPNEAFEVDNEQDAEDLIALNFARRDTTLHVKRTYKRRDLKAEE